MSLDELVTKVTPFHFNEEKLEGKLFYLFVSLVLLIVLYPFFEDLGRGGEVLLALFASLVPLASIYAVSHTQRYFVVASFLGTPFVVINLFNAFFPHSVIFFYQVNTFIAILFYLYTIIILLRAMFSIQRVTVDVIYGAISVYLLFGIMWGTLYIVVQQIWPGSFVGEFSNVLSWSDFLYFSFSTLTTLGYGDVVPVGSHARSLVILEAVAGVLYTTVLISRLVALHVLTKK